MRFISAFSLLATRIAWVERSIAQQDPSQLSLDPTDPRNHYYVESTNVSNHPNGIQARQNPAPTLTPTGALKCAPGSPCVDGSCCGPDNICGFGPSYCGTGCSSACDAKAHCGRDSPGGTLACGMNLCCSNYGWCGVSDAYCTKGKDGCQEGFGSCATKKAYTCDPSAGSATKRTVGYYQGSNVYSRVCNHIRPDQVKTDGFTHLYWAFAQIDPTSFKTVPSDPRDVDLYPAFVDLQKKNIATWVSLGGFDYTTANLHAFSDMVSTPANRQAFITGLVSFLTTHGFSGVDVDWEYPFDDKRGGRPDDMKNLVQLLADMRRRSDFGHKFGISVTLAPDLWYLQHFDATGLLRNADFLGFMSYDLHGTWDSAVPQIGKVVLGQTMIADIEKDLIPLWFDLSQADMSRINFGLALYGRGYTLSDPACNKADGTCYWKAGSKPGPCTNEAGLMSSTEIEALIKDKNLAPQPLVNGNSNAMMKQITWDDQWIGYDDNETILEKIYYASGHCFGGTMAWSVDLASGAGDTSSPPVSTDNTCGPSGKNQVCPSGQCCSQRGYCGTGDAYCGAGCYSGVCRSGGLTTDGSCGVGNSRMWCGGNYPGCCSANGYCGRGDAYCNNDQQEAFHADDPPPPPLAGGSDLCTSKITPELWNKHYVGDYLVARACSEGPYLGLVNAVEKDINTRVEFECAFDTCGVNGGPWDDEAICNQGPEATVALYGIAHFVTFLQSTLKQIDEAVMYLHLEATNMVDTFYPDAPKLDALGDVGTALSAAGAILGLIPDVGPVLGGAASFAGSIASGLASQDTRADVDLKDIEKSWGDTYGAIKTGLRTIVFDAFNRDSSSLRNPEDVPPSWAEQCNDPNSVVQLLKGGAFAQQVDYGDVATPNGITASLASVAINYMWAQQNIIVVKASKNSNLGYDPCDGDRLFGQNTKYCDPDGNMYILQKFHTTSDYPYFPSRAIDNAVPGFSDLSTYFLSTSAVALSSEISQNRAGYRAPSPDAADLPGILKDVFANVDPKHPPLEKLVQFNLPVCDLDVADPGLNNPTQDPGCMIHRVQRSCGEDQACLDELMFNIHMYCGCWQTKDRNGTDFPYGRNDDYCLTPSPHNDCL